jgi:hypothetical protein
VILLSLPVLFVTRRALFSGAQPPPQEPPQLSENRQPAQTQSPFPLDKRIPHPACPNCFKVPGEFGINELVPGTDYVITRDLPDPAPLPPGEVRPDRHSETGEPLWYKGNQAFVGPTDEAPMSASLPIPLIQVKRVLYRHRDELSKIEGVHGVGIGEKGILVSLLPEKRANRRLIPDSLEGVPVYVEEEGGVPTMQ